MAKHFRIMFGIEGKFEIIILTYPEGSYDKTILLTTDEKLRSPSGCHWIISQIIENRHFEYRSIWDTGVLYLVVYYPVTFEFSVSLKEKESLFLLQSL